MPSSNTKFVFFGTDEVSAGVLNALKTGGFAPSLIITRPDRPVGRKQIMTPPLVKVWADKNNIPTLQPEKFKEIENWADKIAGCQLAIVASYGKIIPKWVLDSFPKGVLNVHPSLLPKYRGPTPFQSALLDGANETGVSIMLMDEEMDHGEIIRGEKCKIENTDTYTTLGDKLSKMGGEMLVEIIPQWLAGEITPTKQDHTQATYTRKFTGEDGFIDQKIILGNPTSKEVESAERKVQALNPEPGTYTELKVRNAKGKIESENSKAEESVRVKILSAKVEGGKLVPIRVVPAGRKEMDWRDFLRGQS